MAKTVYNSNIDFLPITLEKIKLKYRVMAGSQPGKDQTRRTYPALEVESLLLGDRDIRFLFSQKELDKMAMDDYLKITNGTFNE